ncbi:MAG: DEAD/DEAH box helicase [Pseudomonadota bacterium]
MEKSQISRSRLESFINLIDPTDWDEGMELYQEGRVKNVRLIDPMVSADVVGIGDKKLEVRLKKHPSGTVIQWVECSCKKNRTYGQYCEHIVALLVHLDREKRDFLLSLDQKMALKPPPPTKRPKGPDSNTLESKEPIGNNLAILTLIEKSAVTKAAISGRGPNLKVEFEVKAKQFDQIELNPEEAFALLLRRKDVLAKSKLKIFETLNETCFIVKDTGFDELHVVKAIALPDELAKLVNPSDPHFASGTFFTLEGDEELKTFLCLDRTDIASGHKVVYIPKVGYAPLAAEGPWKATDPSRVIAGDEVPLFLSSKARIFKGIGKVWFDFKVTPDMVVERPEINSISARDSSDGWFYLSPEYSVGKSTVSLSELLIAIQKKKGSYIRKDKVWIKIPDFLKEFNWQLDSDKTHLKLDSLALLRLQASVGHFDQIAGSKKVLDHISKRSNYVESDEFPSISESKLALRPYQTDALQWMWWLYTNGLHGLLADDMGLGKTHQAMALMTAIQSKSNDGKPRFLVICPTTVLDHWQDKLDEFCPNLHSIKQHGSKRIAQMSSQFTSGKVVLTSYGVLLRDLKHISQINWDLVILDEAHLVKNNSTETYKAVCQIKAKMRLCLTGTPMENHLGELKAIFDFILPAYLGSDDFYRKHYMTEPSIPDNIERLQRLIHPFKMRRTKDQVLTDLPSKVEDIRHCSLSKIQSELYQEIIALRAKPLIDQLSNDSAPVPYLHVFSTLQLLKQICDHPGLVKPGQDPLSMDSGKFELLKELISESLESNNKIVIFSQYVGMINIITKWLSQQKIGYESLTGQTKNRGQVIARFQTDPDKKIFVGSLLAGGIGIDLTAASVVIHYDRWWNASKENQATDRVHRIGQKKFVQVMKLVTRGTLEEKIDRLIASKQALFKNFLERDEELFKTMSRKDIIDLLS